MSALRAVRVGDHGKHGKPLDGRDGAGDEVQDVILQAMAKKITAAEILGISDRHMCSERGEPFLAYAEGGRQSRTLSLQHHDNVAVHFVQKFNEVLRRKGDATVAHSS